MPFTIEDVDKHKKGLKDKEKKQWVAVANSVLKTCIDKEGKEEICAVSAIKQANGVVANSETLGIYATKQDENYSIKTKTRNKKKYMVVPVVMMVEGVHRGSHGPLLHTIDELGKFPASWNKIPVVIDHPTDNEGHNISANSPEVLEQSAVGDVFNTHVNGNRLMAEAWIDPDKLKEVSPNTLEEIKETKIIEVSVGVFVDHEEVENGDWNGEAYKAIARNHRPDHLALLPNSTGACSVKDGCGIRTNKKGENKMDQKTFAELQSNGLFALDIIINGEKSLNERLDALYALVHKDDSQSYCYLEAAYDNYIIYSESPKMGGDRKLYKQNYAINAKSGELELVGDPVEVERQVKYEVINNNALKNKKKMQRGNNDAPCGHCMEKIVAIINSNETAFGPEDREWLLTQEEAVLDKLMPKTKEPAVNKGKCADGSDPNKDETVQANVVVKEVKVPMTLSAEDQAALEFGKKQLAAKRAEQIKGIQDNTSKEIWSDEVLSNMSEDHLERIFKSVSKKESEVDFSLNGNQKRSIETNASIKPMPFTGIDFEEKK